MKFEMPMDVLIIIFYGYEWKENTKISKRIKLIQSINKKVPSSISARVNRKIS